MTDQKKLQLDYSSLQWIIYIFLAGAIYAVLLNNFINWYDSVSYLSSENLFWILFFLFGAGLFFTPIILSLIFTRFQPKRLVPPMMIAIISFSMLAWLLYHRMDVFLQYTYFVGCYIFGAALVQDAISIYFLGINVRSDDIIRYSLGINCPLNKTKEIVEDMQFRNLFGLGRKIKTKDRSFKLKTTLKGKFRMVLEAKESNTPDHSVINMALYHERRYDVKPLEQHDLINEYAKTRLASIKDYLTRNYSLSPKELPDVVAESTVNWVLTDCQGAAIHLQDMPIRKQVSIVFGILFIGVSIGTFAFGKIDWGLASIPIALVFLVDGIRD